MTIRVMNRADIDFCVDCVTNENWLSETRETFELFYNHDPHGCFIGEIDSKPIGMIVATPYDSFGFLGELIVLAKHRGHGYGRRLMDHAIAYLHRCGCVSIYLDGDLPAVPLYERIGFRSVCKSLRFLGQIAPFASDDIRHMIADDLDEICALDRIAFGADRSFFIRRRFELFPDLCRVQNDGHSVAGYLLAQPGHGVVTVGPWYVAPDQSEPHRMLGRLAVSTGATKLRIGVLEANQRAVKLFSNLDGLVPTEPSIRMVLGPEGKPTRADALFAIGSPAAG